ncbi:bacterial proteasome activator family protein [Nocardia uniformis]|uniref:Bacterial proteasome activator n=1 Tax=Nocardia uniformis TaxID=53432 RepID=A0A849CJ22_9NOCA|nr:bacterial proteasome activator family protein [Nocardia uniformis]NNH74121.1 bacterial proteasome activator family protein [Nocardia uniformis]
MTQSDRTPDSIVVIGPEGRPLIIPAAAQVGSSGDEELTGQVLGDDNPDDSDDSGEKEESLADMVEQPAKVMRIGTMIKQLLEEVRHAPLDDASRSRLVEIHRTSIRELEQGLAPDLREELERLALPFSDETIPSDAELRIAQAQLVGWLEGLFHGIQTALFAQQMAARAQLEQMRQLPPGTSLDPRQGGQHGGATGGGQYL